MSASGGSLGGARVQYHLRQILLALDMYPLNRPEVMLSFADESVDAEGNLVNEKTRRLIREPPGAIVAWTRKLKKP